MEVEAGEAGRPREGTASSGEAVSPAAPFGRPSSRLGAPGAAESFDGALRELKDLQSQLHQAADCCEKAFLDTQKKLILESTKSYICDAVVAVIDHLGTVSSKLEHQLQEETEIAQTEQRINFLKQRLLTCEQHAISLQLLTVRADTDAVQYHRCYLSQSTQRTKEENGANSSKEDQTLLEIISPPVPGATRTLKPYDVQSIIGRGPTAAAANFRSPTATRNSFSFRAEDLHIGLGDHKRRQTTAVTSCHFSREVGGMHENQRRQRKENVVLDTQCFNKCSNLAITKS